MQSFGRSLYHLKVRNQDPTTLVGVVLVVLFAYLIAAPVLLLVADAFVVQFADQARARQPMGELTSYYIERVFLSRISMDVFWRPLMHTALISIASIV